MGPCQELFGGVYGNIDIFFNMANCLGLGRGTNSSAPSNGTTGSGSSPSTVPFTGAAPVNGIQRGLWVGMITFQMAIRWVAFNL